MAFKLTVAFAFSESHLQRFGTDDLIHLGHCEFQIKTSERETGVIEMGENIILLVDYTTSV